MQLMKKFIWNKLMRRFLLQNHCFYCVYDEIRSMLHNHNHNNVQDATNIGDELEFVDLIKKYQGLNRAPFAVKYRVSGFEWTVFLG